MHLVISNQIRVRVILRYVNHTEEGLQLLKNQLKVPKNSYLCLRFSAIFQWYLLMHVATSVSATHCKVLTKCQWKIMTIVYIVISHILLICLEVCWLNCSLIPNFYIPSYKPALPYHFSKLTETLIMLWHRQNCDKNIRRKCLIK